MSSYAAFLEHGEAIVTGDYTPLIVSIGAQFILGWLWYSNIFHAPFARYLAADKGVKKLDQVLTRYNLLLCFAVSILCCFIRAFFLMLFMSMTGLDSSSCNLTKAAFALWIVVISGYSNAFWTQRPCFLISIDMGYELACFMAAALVQFLTKN